MIILLKLIASLFLFLFYFQEQIKKYGRFPKRNKILGRENTPEEEADLKDWKDPF